MIALKNATCRSAFLQLGSAEPRWVAPEETLQFPLIANTRVRIGYRQGDGNLWTMLDNQQSLCGVFTMYQSRLMPKIQFNAFESDDDDGEPYTDEQYRRVAAVFQCKCVHEKCLCMIPSKRKINCMHLVRNGLLTEQQLDNVLEEMLS
jgi:hypothetical protein